MTLTLLFDLDDTLLGNNTSTFLPEYTRGLAKRMLPYVDPIAMVKNLHEATGLMMKNKRSDMTLEDVFNRAFYPALEIKRSDVQAVIDQYYLLDFPKLQGLTQFLPQAEAVVLEALHCGYQVAVATNPLFPVTAALQRLAWSGLPVERIPWRIVPNYSTFHFAKPRLEFYAELLGQIGWPEGPVVMVGNDLAADVQPGRAFGLATFLVNNQPFSLVEAHTPRHAQGRLEDLLRWLDMTQPDALIPELNSQRSLMANLRAAPAALASLTQSLPPEAWKAKPFAQEWCLTEIMCHLRDAEAEVNLPRLERVLSKDNPFITGMNTDVWAEERQYFSQDGPQALNEFQKQRQNFNNMLEEMTEENWSLPARHAIFGPINLQELVNINASHDRLHLQTVYQLVQIQSDLSTQAGWA